MNVAKGRERNRACPAVTPSGRSAVVRRHPGSRWHRGSSVPCRILLSTPNMLPSKGPLGSITPTYIVAIAAGIVSVHLLVLFWKARIGAAVGFWCSALLRQAVTEEVGIFADGGRSDIVGAGGGGRKPFR
jgi:hypothetical protein